MHMMNGSFCSMLLMIIFWVGLISLGVFLLTSFIRGGKNKTPLYILNERLAKGEIDKMEYKQLKDMIK